MQLTDNERSVLSKGLSFVPLKQHTDTLRTRVDAEAFFRRLRLKAFFHDKDSEDSDDSEHSERNIFDNLQKKSST